MAASSSMRAYMSRVSAHATHAASWLGGRIARSLAFLALIAVLGYWIFVTIWQPLTAPVPLPDGVSERDPMIDAGLLQAISDQRSARVEFVSEQLSLQGLLVEPTVNQ